MSGNPEKIALAKEYLESLRLLGGFETAEITVHTRQFESVDSDLPIHKAAWQKDFHAMEALIEAGADVDAQGEDEYTALQIASSCGNTAMVKLLLKHGARRDLMELYGKTALDLAILLGRSEIVDLLKS